MQQTNIPRFSFLGLCWGLFLSFLFVTVLFTFGKEKPELQVPVTQLQTLSQGNLLTYAWTVSLGLFLLTLSVSFLKYYKKLSNFSAQTDTQKWLLALGALYVQQSEVLGRDNKAFERIDMTRPWYGIFISSLSRESLKSSWGITDHHSAVDIFDRLLHNAKILQDKTKVAWDGVRLVHVARVSCMVGYITTDEFWHYLYQLGPVMQKNFSSWSDLSLFFQKARNYYFPNKEEAQFKRYHEELVAHPESPWNKLAWKTPLSR